MNVVLLETNPDQAMTLASRVAGEVDRLSETHATFQNIEWLPGIDPPDLPERKYFNPVVHLVSGSFDVAALFLSPHLDFGSWLQKDGFMAAGQDINSCLLLEAKSLGAEEAFNEEFVAAFSSEEISELRQDYHFLGIIKVKLNPNVTWPSAKEELEVSTDRFTRQLREVWLEVERWRASVQSRGDAHRPLTGLGLSCGWNEIMVVTLCDGPADIMKLCMTLRQLSWPPDEGAEGQALHLVHTSITSIGHDYRLARAVLDRFDENVLFAEDLTPSAAGASLVELLDGSPELTETSRSADDDKVFFQVGCHLYPGHEQRVNAFFQGLADAVHGPGSPRESTSFEVGKRDIWSPRMPVAGPDTPGLASPQAAAAAVHLIKRFLRGPLDDSGQAEIPDAFDFFIRIGIDGGALDEFGASTLGNHREGLPRTLLGEKLGLAEPPARNGSSLASRLRASLRILQVPYALSEQILHVANTFWWGNDREILWEESVEVAPVVYALANYLESKVKWWNMGDFTCDQEPAEMQAHLSHQDNHATQVARMLGELLDPNILLFLQSFRAVFYNRHLSSYLTDGTPDLNLRYRGSVQQLLSGTQMILDTLVSIVLGEDRASMVAIGDRVSPEVKINCSIVTVQQSGATFRSPLLMESIAHEVGHQLLVELNRDCRTPSWRAAAGVGQHPSRPEIIKKSFEDLQDRHKHVNYTFFHGELSNERNDEVSKFIESTADLIEFTLLYGPNELEKWVQSFLLRMVLASPPTLPYGSTDPSRDDVPAYDDRLVVAGILRVALVFAARKLFDDDASLEPEGFRGLRKILFEKSLIGSSHRAFGILSNDANWERFIEEQVLNRVWLRTDERRRISSGYFRSLVNYLNVERSDSKTKDLLALIRSAFSTYRKALLDNMLPSLFIRAWMSAEQRQAARDRELRVKDDFSHPWVAVPQPLVEHEALASSQRGDAAERWKSVQEIELKSLVFQRGVLVPFDTSFSESLGLAQQEFWTKLFLALPFWRGVVAKKVLGASEAAAADV